MLSRVIPKVQTSGVRLPAVYLTPFSVFFNEEYLKNANSTLANDRLYYYGFDSYSEHHVLTPIYRAVKTGRHLSNMGYNDSRPEFFDLQKIDTNAPHFYNYKGMYLSSFNNSAEVFYDSLPRELKHITNDAQELEAARHTTNFRYVMGGFHILGYILIFGILLYKFGLLIAWSFGAAVLSNPLNFFLALSPIAFPASSLLLFVPILYFYPHPKESFFSKQYRYMVISVTLINAFLLWIAQPLSSLFLTWAVAVAFALDTVYAFQENTFPKNWAHIVLRTSLLAGVSLLPLIPIFVTEITQQSQWLGLSKAEIWKIATDRVGDVRYNSLFIPEESGYQIRSLADWVLHFAKGIYRNLKYPITAPFLWLDRVNPPSFLPQGVHALLTIKLIYGLFLFICFQVWLWFKQKINPEYKKYLLYCLIFWGSYVFYFLGFHFVSPRLASHVHVIAPIFSFYQTILLFVMVGFGIKIYKN